MFWIRNKENNFPIHTLIWRPGLIQVFTFGGSQIRILRKNLKVVLVIIAVDSHNVVHEMNSSHKTFH